MGTNGSGEVPMRVGPNGSLQVMHLLASSKLPFVIWGSYKVTWIKSAAPNLGEELKRSWDKLLNKIFLTDTQTFAN